MPGLDNLLDEKSEEFEESKKKIEEGIKERVKGVLKLERKEIDFTGQRVTFALSQADVERSETALSFAALFEIFDEIQIKEIQKGR